MHLILALVTDCEARLRIRSALHGEAAVEFCDERAALLVQVANQPTSVVITELWDAAGAPMATAVERLRTRFPALPMLAYCVLRPETSRELLAMARAGVNGLVLRGIDDVGDALCAALAAADDDCLEVVMTRELGTLSAANLRSVVAQCLTQPRSRHTVASVAAAMGVNRRTLVNRFTHAGLPTPSEVIGWCRLLLAARLLEDPERSVESVGLALKFGSGAALANMLRRYTGLLPTELRRRGGVDCLLEALRRELESERRISVASSVAEGGATSN
jgi:AraC-like DNA-binding protein